MSESAKFGTIFSGNLPAGEKCQIAAQIAKQLDLYTLTIFKMRMGDFSQVDEFAYDQIVGVSVTRGIFGIDDVQSISLDLPNIAVKLEEQDTWGFMNGEALNL